MQPPISRMQLRKQAQRGHPQAIAFFLNHALKQTNVEAKALLKQGTLHILLESAEVLPQAQWVAFVQRQLQMLRLETPLSINLYARLRGHQQPNWQVVVQQHPTAAAIAPAARSSTIPRKRVSPVGVTQPKPRQIKRFVLRWVGGILLLSGVLIAIALLYDYWQQRSQPEMLQIPVPANAAASIDRRDPFARAVNHATNAATLAQRARLRSEWQLVACHWEEAIALMGVVPIYHSRWELAQQKIVEYQRNLTYAQLQGSQAPNPSP